jgi:hypothetical protein
LTRLIASQLYDVTPRSLTIAIVAVADGDRRWRASLPGMPPTRAAQALRVE